MTLQPRVEPTWVVCLGASAGGLEALEAFFDGVSNSHEATFLVVTHSHPGHVSMLPELLAKHTVMSVQEARDNTLPPPVTSMWPRPVRGFHCGADASRSNQHWGPAARA